MNFDFDIPTKEYCETHFEENQTNFEIYENYKHDIELYPETY